MRVLGIDCGIATTGWAVVEKINKGGDYAVLGYGVIRTSARMEMPERLAKLYEELLKIIGEFGPDCTAVETLYYFRNQKTIISVGQARGVILLAVGRKQLPVYDYTPLQVKQAVVGYGKATKEQVQKMIKILLKLKKIPKPDDASDALAIAVCHLNTGKIANKNLSELRIKTNVN